MNYWKFTVIAWVVISIFTAPLKVSPAKAKENLKAWMAILTPRPR